MISFPIAFIHPFKPSVIHRIIDRRKNETRLPSLCSYQQKKKSDRETTKNITNKQKKRSIKV